MLYVDEPWRHEWKKLHTKGHIVRYFISMNCPELGDMWRQKLGSKEVMANGWGIFLEDNEVF